jgi:divalent metal cation (Fe/Co/Zn/Cd) transporter
VSAGSLAAPPAAARAAVLRNRVRWVVRATITYNAIEAAVALAAGAVASSSALIGFGLGSIVEVLSAAAIAWQFAGGRNHQVREHTALRVIAFSFFALAGFVTYDALRTLTSDGAAEHSNVGIVLAAVSLALMPGLARWERRLGRELGSGSVVADSAQLSLCAALSAVLLVGLLMNSLLGWSWADPVAALVIAAVAVRAGRNALRGDTCCVPPAALLVNADADDACCGGRS